MLRQNGPPGLISNTSGRSPAWRKSSTPALRGGGIHRALDRGLGFGNPAPAKQASAVINDRRLPWRDPIFGRRKADPIAITQGWHSGRQRADLDVTSP